METLPSTRTDDIQESMRENSQPKDTYRAPRLVALGTAVGLVQFLTWGAYLDWGSGRGPTRP
jgi:hypothetical protein